MTGLRHTHGIPGTVPVDSFDVFLFEEEPACDVEARNLYLPEVERSDIYLGVLGAQFGNADADGVSPTEREYDLATTKGKERLVFVKKEFDGDCPRLIPRGAPPTWP